MQIVVTLHYSEVYRLHGALESLKLTPIIFRQHYNLLYESKYRYQIWYITTEGSEAPSAVSQISRPCR